MKKIVLIIAIAIFSVPVLYAQKGNKGPIKEETLPTNILCYHCYKWIVKTTKPTTKVLTFDITNKAEINTNSNIEEYTYYTQEKDLLVLVNNTTEKIIFKLDINGQKVKLINIQTKEVYIGQSIEQLKYESPKIPCR